MLKKVIPDFWKEHYQTGKGKVVRGVYGINIDKQMGQENFDYLIADPYQEQVIPEGFVLETIPELNGQFFRVLEQCLEPCKMQMLKYLRNGYRR